MPSGPHTRIALHLANIKWITGLTAPWLAHLSSGLTSVIIIRCFLSLPFYVECSRLDRLYCFSQCNELFDKIFQPDILMPISFVIFWHPRWKLHIWFSSRQKSQPEKRWVNIKKKEPTTTTTLCNWLLWQRKCCMYS